MFRFGTVFSKQNIWDPYIEDSIEQKDKALAMFTSIDSSQILVNEFGILMCDIFPIYAMRKS